MTKKETILAKALELFGERGYESTPTSLIAKEAGVSEGLIFRHFTNKAGLLTAIISEGVSQIAATMEHYAAGADPRAAIVRHIEQALGTIQVHEQFWRLATKIRFQAAVQETAQTMIERANQFIINDLTGNFKKMGVEDPAAEALMLFALIDGVCIHWLQDPKHYPLEKMKTLLIQKYSHGQF
jgi:AcrR family transcriptional regulator